ncbi:hypothetical protein [Parasphaerochaeta coccoides]|uniref:Uncharacterized protein n=1 Tax=Parasphaerochaeta coccoides (strain ATCC BAA-1237 / DSM 17374 / SPN1) TaxID=760011 RepID=F4GKF3_PARC1|nr:hypothetical protein [Parasphaerochaeta coccoides]AEC02836.1 hypothetical protein Spico_1638 [Parasphaerochaeta coccoides DSM 17374]
MNNTHTLFRRISVCLLAVLLVSLFACNVEYRVKVTLVANVATNSGEVVPTALGGTANPVCINTSFSRSEFVSIYASDVYVKITYSIGKPAVSQKLGDLYTNGHIEWVDPIESSNSGQITLRYTDEHGSADFVVFYAGTDMSVYFTGEIGDWKNGDGINGGSTP